MQLVPTLDLFPLLAAVLAAITCGLLGNFLVLRRLSLMGDAISHSVLPGIVVAFLVFSTRSPLPMLLGAGIAGVLTVMLVEVVRRVGGVEPGAAIGVVFSLMFALGVLLLEGAAESRVDLDPDCVLHGQLESLAWFGGPETWRGVLSPATLEALPRQVWMLLAVCAISLAVVTVLFKELRLAAFDPSLATALGFDARILHVVLMTLVAAAAVACFEAVGSILVVAMLVCPAATARLLTDRLPSQLLASVLVALAAAVLGYLAATMLPALVGLPSVNAAGSIATVAGFLLVVAVVAAPEHGLIARAWRRRRVARETAGEDLLAALYRARESGLDAVQLSSLPPALALRNLEPILRQVTNRGWVERREGTLRLTTGGLAEASALVRRHRLWETYLVDEAGLAPDHVHETAERLEHAPIAIDLDAATDPQGKRIPPQTE